MDRQFNPAGTWALAGAGLSSFDFIHGMHLGIGPSPLVILGSLALAEICLTVMWSEESSR
jgi:hypothetical protein